MIRFMITAYCRAEKRRRNYEVRAVSQEKALYLFRKRYGLKPLMIWKAPIRKEKYYEYKGMLFCVGDGWD